MKKQKSIDRTKWLGHYKEYLKNVRGLSVITQRTYVLIARRFLESLGHGRWIKQSQFTARAITEFVQCDSAARRGSGPSITVSGTRFFLRFLTSQSVVQASLEAAVPSVRCYKHASLPRYFTEAEVEKLLEASKDDTKVYALLVLISRLGLRIEEAAKLTLDDIDWVNGFLVIRPGKNRCERRLPLAQDLAEAVLSYLRSRPKVTDRHIFLRVTPPHKPYDGSGLGRVVQRILVKHGMKQPFGGAHQFRHSAATKMVNQGATFKAIADLLGHKSLATTAIYAKLDLESLTRIALPWPGGKS